MPSIFNIVEQIFETIMTFFYSVDAVNRFKVENACLKSSAAILNIREFHREKFNGRVELKFFFPRVISFGNFGSLVVKNFFAVNQNFVAVVVAFECGIAALVVPDMFNLRHKNFVIGNSVAFIVENFFARFFL